MKFTNIVFTPEKNVKNNIEIAKASTHMQWEDGVEIREVINVPMGIILLGKLQKEKFNYEGGGTELHEINKEFKKKCFDYLLKSPELHSFIKEINGEIHTWEFTGKITKTGNAVFVKTKKNGIKLLLSIPVNEVIEVKEIGNLQCLASRLKKQNRGFFKFKKTFSDTWEIKRIQ